MNPVTTLALSFAASAGKCFWSELSARPLPLGAGPVGPHLTFEVCGAAPDAGRWTAARLRQAAGDACHAFRVTRFVSVSAGASVWQASGRGAGHKVTA